MKGEIMAEQEIEKHLRSKIYELKELKGNNIAEILLSTYKSLSENTNIEKRLDTISILWSYIENILNTSDKDNLHPYLKQQDDPEQSKKGFLGNAWEQIFESLANEFLDTLGVKVIRFSKENVENFLAELGIEILEKKFNAFKKLGLIEETRFFQKKNSGHALC